MSYSKQNLDTKTFVTWNLQQIITQAILEELSALRDEKLFLGLVS